MQLIFGLILLGIVQAWSSDASKRAFFGFVLLGMVILPAVLLTTAVVIESMMSYRSYQAQRIIEWVGMIAVFGLSFFSYILLLLYAILRGREEFLVDGVFSAATRSPYRLQEVWKTELTGQQTVAILRKREWAFLIEFAPLLISFTLLVIVAGIEGGIENRSYGRRMTYTAVFSWFSAAVLIATMIYLVVKDSIRGVSLGKSITGCRVVSIHTGEPIQMPQSLARNFVMLIPLFPLVELFFASFRKDRRRMGDLLAGTIVVSGGPAFIEGVAQPTESDLRSEEVKPAKHPLDD